MGTIKEYFEKLISLLAEYDIRKILEAIRKLEWQEQLANPIAWLVVLPPLIYLIWRQQIRLLVLLCSFVAVSFPASVHAPSVRRDNLSS